MTTYYTYYSYEEFGRGYIGYRKCPEKYTPETDPYLGSYSDKKFKPTHKIILGTYDNRTEAIADEITLHRAYDVASNLHFANRACQLSTGFSTAGLKVSAETRAKMKGRKVSAETRAKMKGRKVSAETRAKISEAHRGKHISTETRAKLSKSSRKIFSAEMKMKLSEFQRNRIPIEESKHFYWVNKHTGTVHEHMSVRGLMSLYPELKSSGLYAVANSIYSQYKGWTISLKS